MKRNLKRKHLSHERTKGSANHGKGTAAKFSCGTCLREGRTGDFVFVSYVRRRGRYAWPFLVIMIRTGDTTSKARQVRWYRGPDIPMRVIRRFARQVAERFQPDKIILFGSYAYGTPHADSDVDILVIMPARNEIDQAVKIQWAIRPAFSLDLVVRTPKNMEWRLTEGDWFLREVVAPGQSSL